MLIRPGQAQDIPALYKICLQTADAGRDATALVRNHRLIGDYYVGPYLHFSDGLCFVIEQGKEVVGYLVGVADSQAYYRWLNSKWLPKARRQYSHNMVTKGDLEQLVLEQIHNDAKLAGYLRRYPGHLHISVLPKAQRLGIGGKLMAHFIRHLTANKVIGMHLAVSRDNVPAVHFYQKLQFECIKEYDDALIMGLDLSLE